MNNKALMGVCAVVLVAILAGTYLWIDLDDDYDGPATWHATHVEYIIDGSDVGMYDADVDEELQPFVISHMDKNKFIGERAGIPIIGITDGEHIEYEYTFYNFDVYGEGIIYDGYMNIVEIMADGDVVSITFTQYTHDGKPAASMEGSYFDFDIPFTPIDCMHYQGGVATSVATSPLELEHQDGMIATFNMNVLGIDNEYTIAGIGYTKDGTYCAIGYGSVNGDYEYCGVDIADGLANFLFTCTGPEIGEYNIFSTYEVPYQGGVHNTIGNLEGTWTGVLDALYADGSVKSSDVIKVIEKVDDKYYTCTEVTADNGIFIWDILVEGDYIDVRVYRTIDGTTEEIGFLTGPSFNGLMFLTGVQYRPGHVDGYAVTMFLELNP